MENVELRKLAENLKKMGLASSMYEAFEKAKSIMNIKSQKTDASQAETETQQTQNKETMPNLGADIKNEDATLNEVMKEANINPAEVEAEEKRRTEDIKADISEVKQEIEHAEETPEKIEEIKKEVEEIREEADVIAGDKTEEQENISIEQSNISNEQQTQETEDRGKQPEQPAAQPEQQNPKQEDMFKEQKKVDLTKVFNNNSQNN